MTQEELFESYFVENSTSDFVDVDDFDGCRRKCDDCDDCDDCRGYCPYDCYCDGSFMGCNCDDY